MNRMRIGHTYLTQKYLLHGDEQPLCISCNEALTVRHVFFDCVEFMDVRDQYFLLQELFDDVTVDVILNFIIGNWTLVYKNILIYNLCYVNKVL